MPRKFCDERVFILKQKVGPDSFNESFQLQRKINCAASSSEVITDGAKVPTVHNAESILFLLSAETVRQKYGIQIGELATLTLAILREQYGIYVYFHHFGWRGFSTLKTIVDFLEECSHEFKKHKQLSERAPHLEK